MNLWIVLPIVVLVAVLYVLLPVAAAATSYFRGPRIVRCPLKGADTPILVGRAGLAEMLGRRSLRRVEACGLWKDGAPCREDCLRLADGAFREMRAVRN